MVDLASEAFNKQRFNLAADIYERQIQVQGPKPGLLLGAADSHICSGSLMRALEYYVKAVALGGKKIKPEAMACLITELVEKMQLNGVIKKGAEEVDKELNDIFTCQMCKSLLEEPATLSCGHTFCLQCIQKRENCKTCGSLYDNRSWSKHLKATVLVKQTIEKWFPQEMHARKLKRLGNKLFTERKYEEAVKVYSEALKHVPDDHLVASNRSYALCHGGRYQEAVKDAEMAVCLRPNWPKGYYRKAKALQALGEYENAVAAYLFCLALDPSVDSVKDELGETLIKVLSPARAPDTKPADVARDRAASVPLSGSSAIERLLHSRELETPASVESSDTMSLKTLLLTCLKSSGRSLPSSPEHARRGRDVEVGGAGGVAGRKRSHHEAVERTNSAPSISCGASSSQGSRDSLVSATEEGDETGKAAEKGEEGGETSKEGVSKGAGPSSSPSSSPEERPLPRKCRNVDTSLIKRDDFECALCSGLLWGPMTTPCGHTFCGACLDRCLDHKPSCPLCKTSLVEFVAERVSGVTLVVEDIMRVYLPDEYQEREKQKAEEMRKLQLAGLDENHEIPVFVCTLAFPGVVCPLHVFEPRYRLMVRQCMEVGTRQFGMCLSSDTGSGFVDYGVMLEIRDVQYLPDGRALVDTVGGRRFKVVDRGSRDGYHTATVEWVEDTPPEPEALSELRVLHAETFRQMQRWFSGLSSSQQHRIKEHFGALPDILPDPMVGHCGPAWHWWLLAVLPLDTRAKLAVLASSSLNYRLTLLSRAVAQMVHQQQQRRAS